LFLTFVSIQIVRKTGLYKSTPAGHVALLSHVTDDRVDNGLTAVDIFPYTNVGELNSGHGWALCINLILSNNGDSNLTIELDKKRMELLGSSVWLVMTILHS
jgi:hypothetical protein